MTAHGEANERSPDGTTTAHGEGGEQNRFETPTCHRRPVRHVRIRDCRGTPATALRTCRTVLVAQVWYNMLVSHARKRTVVAGPATLGSGEWQTVVGANGTPYGTQRALDTLSDVP